MILKKHRQFAQAQNFNKLNELGKNIPKSAFMNKAGVGRQKFAVNPKCARTKSLQSVRA